MWPTGQRRPYNPVWPATVRHVRQRSGGQCEVYDEDGVRCTERMAEVDHIVPWYVSHDDRVENAQAICAWHHTRKTQREAINAAQAKRSRGKRSAETHPFDL